jgi:hypothetical protein
VDIILTSNVYKDGLKIYVLYVDIINNHQLSNFVNYVINVKDFGYVLFVDLDYVVVSQTIF